MSKLGIIFSGQGAQYYGMGKEISSFEVANQVYETASKAVGFNVSELCFTENDNLNITEFTQVAILTTSIAIYEVLKSKGVEASEVAGLSLGEYSALVAAGVIGLTEAVKLVNKRGKFMTEAVPTGVGGMAAIIGMEKDVLLDIVNEAGCEISNYNCPKQLVIGGEKEAVLKACDLALEKGARRAIPLNVSGPFHTSLLKPASDKLSIELENIEFNTPNIPVVMNVTADYLKGDVKELLTKQVMSSVLWEDSIRKMISNGVDTFIEVGPGKVLSGFVKKIDKSLTILNVEDMDSLNKTLNKMEVK
ncbi:ACP S-malonyltransferase [Mycoplasmatota bacterium WC44]